MMLGESLAIAIAGGLVGGLIVRAWSRRRAVDVAARVRRARQAADRAAIETLVRETARR